MLKQKAKGKQKRSFKDKQVFNDYLHIFNSLIIKWNFFFTFFSLSVGLTQLVAETEKDEFEEVKKNTIQINDSCEIHTQTPEQISLVTAEKNIIRPHGSKSHINC